MKRCSISLMIIIILLVTTMMPQSFCFAQESVSEALTLCVPEDLPNTVDKFLYAAFNKIGYKISVQSNDTGSGLEGSSSGRIGGIAVQSEGKETNYPNIVMVREPIIFMDTVFYVRDDYAGEIKAWEELSGQKIGYLYEKKYIQSHVPSDVRSVTNKATRGELLQGLLDHEYDIAVISRPQYDTVLSPQGLQYFRIVENTPGYLYLNKQYTDLIPKLEKVLRDMRKSGELEKIYSREMSEEKDYNTFLYISSYSADIEWEQQISHGIQTLFESNPLSEIYVTNLNTKQYPDDRGRLRSILSMIRRDFVAKRPDVVIVSDNNALDFMKEHYDNLFMGVPVVFCGINHYSPDMIKGYESYFTGIAEILSTGETVEQMLTLFPQTKMIYVLNDYLKTGTKFRDDMMNGLKPYQDKISITHNENLPMSQLLEEIKGLPSDTLILKGVYFLDGTGQYYLDSEATALFCEHAPVPVFGVNMPTSNHGALGGRFTDGYIQGYQAARIAQMLLDGKKVSDIPVITDPNLMNRWVFDYNVMQQFNIDAKDLPDGTQVIHQPPSLFERYPNLETIVLVTAVAGSILIIGLFITAGILRRNNNRLKQAQESLHTAEELLLKDRQIEEVKNRLEKIIATAPVGYAIAIGAEAVDCNQYVQDTIGMIPGCYLPDFYVNPEDRDRIYKKLEHGDVIGETVLYKMRQGEPHHFRINIARVEYEQKEATVLWGVDIENDEQQKERLIKSQEDMRRMVDTLPVPVLISDTQTIAVKYANKKYLELFGFANLEEAIGFKMARLYTEQEKKRPAMEKLRDSFDRIIKEGTIEKWEWQYTLPDGSVMDAYVTAGAITFEGQSAVLRVIKDASAEKRQEEMLRNMAEKEKEANRIKDRFIVNVSHEMRTPMNAIIGLSEVALMREHSEHDQETYRRINTSARNLLVLINDILDFSKIEAEKLELIEEEFKLEEIISNVLMLTGQRLKGRDVEVSHNVAGDVPEMIYGDKTRLWQILKNIMDNSAKFTKAGFIRFDVFHRENTLIYRIEDTGVGMEKEQVERLFVPFEQFSQDAYSLVQGTGLGMSITKELITLMGGEIEVESEKNKGTTSTIRIPVKTCPGEGSGYQVGADHVRVEIDKVLFPDAKVLLCEDNEINQTVASEILEVFGITPKIAENGQEALRLLEKEEFDLILMDIIMPVMDGHVTTVHIRESQKPYADIPIIAMTANVMKDEVEKCMGEGMNGHIGKPIDIQKLYEALKKWLPQERQERQES